MKKSVLVVIGILSSIAACADEVVARRVIRAEWAAWDASNRSPTQDHQRSKGSRDSLPGDLLASIGATLPGFRILTPSEVNSKKPYKRSSLFSFYCEGDFTSSGHPGFALILVREGQTRFAIFTPDAGGKYELVYLARPKTAEEWGKDWRESLVERPEQIELRTIAKGESWAPEAGDTIEDMRVPADAIELHMHPKPNYDFASLILYKDGSFRQISYEPLVRLK